MAIIQVRDVPDQVAEVISERAAAAQMSVSAYLRELMARDAERELRRRAMREHAATLRQVRQKMDLSRVRTGDTGQLVREAREEYERSEDAREQAGAER